MGEQVPVVPGSAHDRQPPAQAVWQQTPWAQIPDTQSSLPLQVAPLGRRPQVMPLQTFPGAQSLAMVQPVRHCPLAPHAYGLQLWVVPGVQVATPSHRPASVEVDPVQVGGAQGVPAA